MAALLALSACARETDRVSIVLVTLDTVRMDHVGAFGGPVEITPHLDALARGGLVHENAFTTMPTTGPAHLSLMTGLLPSAHGARDNAVPLPASLHARTLASRLHASGYSTGAFVTSMMVDPRATGLGDFEVYEAPRAELRSGREAIDGALHWLGVAREPVFLWVHLYDAHAPYGTPDQKRRGLPVDPGRHGWIDARLYADPVARRRMRADYALGVREADAALGALLEGVRERVSSAPLVVVVADHGESLDEHLEARGYAFDHGEFLDFEQIRIPLVLAGPGVGAGRSRGVVSIRDLYTTLLSAAGIPDESAAAEGRRDLRLAASGERLAIVERRRFAGAGRREISRTAEALVDGHALAIAGEGSLLVVGENAQQTLVSGEGAPALGDTARSALEAVRGSDSGARSEIDPTLREALRHLGYAQ